MRALRILPLVVLAAGCGRSEPETHASLTDAHIKAMEEMVTVLDGIHDRKSAEAARGAMEAIGRRVREINALEDKLPEAGPTEQAQLDAKLERAATMLELRMQQVMERVKGDDEAVRLVANLMIDAALDPGRDRDPPGLDPDR